MILMLDIVLRAFHRISKRVMGLNDYVEAEAVAGLRIVGMEARSEKTKYPLDRLRVGVRPDFQDLVVVGECKCIHGLLRSERPPASAVPSYPAFPISDA